MGTHLLFFGLLFSFAAAQGQTDKRILILTKGFSRLNDSLYISQTETSRLEYIGYLSAIEKDSSRAFYESQLTDSLTMEYIANANDYYKSPMYSGYSYPGYWSYAAVGVSYEHAVNYCRWKTAVMNAELRSLSDGKEPDFWIEYRLPSAAEWELAYGDNKRVVQPSAKKNYSGTYIQKWYTDAFIKSLNIKGLKRGDLVPSTLNTKDTEAVIYKDTVILYSKPALTGYSEGPQPGLITDYFTNENMLYHMVGNVSEMTNVKGEAKGSNYEMDYDFYDPLIEIGYDKPEPWLGMRLVCVIHRIP